MGELGVKSATARFACASSALILRSHVGAELEQVLAARPSNFRMESRRIMVVLGLVGIGANACGVELLHVGGSRISTLFALDIRTGELLDRMQRWVGPSRVLIDAET